MKITQNNKFGKNTINGIDPEKIWSMEDGLTKKESYLLGVICVLAGIAVVWLMSFI